MSDLLPCPFCGGIDLDPLANCVGCLDCGARGPTQEEIEILCDPDFAKEQWNRRALPTTDARADALREAAKVADEHTFGGPAVRDAILALIEEAKP